MSMCDKPPAPDLVSIVVLSYNRRECLRRTLANVQGLPGGNREVIVVDNNSSDGSVEMVRTEFPEVRLIAMDRNTGVPGGRNVGYRAARGAYIISLDDDVVCPADTIEQTVRLFEENPQAGCLAYLIHMHPQDYFMNKVTSSVLGNYAGGAHAFRHAPLRDIGYLDERFFFMAEEIDASLRLREAGYLTLYAPHLVIDHYGPLAKGGERGRRRVRALASWCWFYWKHFPFCHAVLLSCRVAASFALAAVRHRQYLEFFKGCWTFLRGLPSVWRVRRVASAPTVAFYIRPDTEPPHYNVSMLKKAGRELRRLLTSQRN